MENKKKDGFDEWLNAIGGFLFITAFATTPAIYLLLWGILGMQVSDDVLVHRLKWVFVFSIPTTIIVFSILAYRKENKNKTLPPKNIYLP